MRALVGNGSIHPPPLYLPLAPIVGRGRREKKRNVITARVPFVNPFRIFTYPDVIVSLIFTGVVYAVNYTITATISSAFADAYTYLSETDLGLCYLSTGGGMIIGSSLTGKLLDREYKSFKTRIELEKSSDDLSGDEDFPIELVRLRTMPYHLVLFVACVIGWGWCLEKKVPIAGPLALQFGRKLIPRLRAVIVSSEKLTRYSWIHLNGNP
jgi:hypothetical protein